MIYTILLWLAGSEIFFFINEGSDKFNEVGLDLGNIINSNGLVITISSYVIVFLSLFFLYLIFTWLTKFLLSKQLKRITELGKPHTDPKDLYISGEEIAAIAAALALHYEESHDFENTVLTINRVQKPYSPWSSKIYNLVEKPIVIKK